MNSKPLPKVIIAGMPRAGTTYLYFQLHNHPSLHTPVRKETNYFSVFHFKGPQWYENLYSSSGQAKWGVDASPVYFMDEHAIDRIREYPCDVRIILGIRDIPSWTYSLYRQIQSHTYSGQSFSDFLNSPAWDIGGKSFPITFRDGFFKKRIDLWIKTFQQDILVFHYDLLAQNPVRLLQSIEQFLGIPTWYNEHTVLLDRINASGRKQLKLFSWILRNETVINMALGLLPEKLLWKIRNRLFSLSKPARDNSNSEEKEKAVKRVSELFPTDIGYIKTLFQDTPLFVGDKDSK